MFLTMGRRRGREILSHNLSDTQSSNSAVCLVCFVVIKSAHLLSNLSVTSSLLSLTERNFTKKKQTNKQKKPPKKTSRESQSCAYDPLKCGHAVCQHVIFTNALIQHNSPGLVLVSSCRYTLVASSLQFVFCLKFIFLKKKA